MTVERHYSPLKELIVSRLREFFREPEAIFWVYGFPVLMVVALGIAFRNQPVEQIVVDVVDGPQAAATVKALEASATPERFKAKANPNSEARLRLRTGKTDVVVAPGVVDDRESLSIPVPGQTENPPPRYEYLFDPTRPQSVLAQCRGRSVAAGGGRKDVVPVTQVAIDEPGGRYIDFLVPGLLGMSLMGGGMWGVGFVTVDMRIRKLLKRFLATPMKKWHFLSGIMLSRMLFMVPEVLLLLVFARYAFGVVNQGSAWTVAFLILLGAVMFSGLGLLIASRANTIEMVTGLMNVVQLPMWILSGIFFSAERFPAMAQPLIRPLPLTLLIDALRAVMLEGATFVSQWQRIGMMAAWAVVTFALALRWFKWR